MDYIKSQYRVKMLFLVSHRLWINHFLVNLFFQREDRRWKRRNRSQSLPSHLNLRTKNKDQLLSLGRHHHHLERRMERKKSLRWCKRLQWCYLFCKLKTDDTYKVTSHWHMSASYTRNPVSLTPIGKVYGTFNCGRHLGNVASSGPKIPGRKVYC